MKLFSLDEVERQIASARSPHALFGTDIDGVLARLQASCHPDVHPDDERAQRLFRQLGDLADQARKPPVTVKSPKRSYVIQRLLGVGDIADVHLASANDVDYVLKISRVKDGDALLDAERKAIATILTAAGDKHYRRFFPTLAESFPARGKFQKRVNVFLHEPGQYTFEQVRTKHESGLDSRHLAWIFKRLLVASGFVHRSGYIHGALLPTHILLHPRGHGLQLIDWTNSVQPGSRLKTISAAYRDWYPPEVFKKQPATPATDIYMAAKCMIYIAGGDPKAETIPASVEPTIARFLKSCLLPGQKMRPDDAWDLYDEYDRLLYELFGAPKFHHLTM